MEHERWLDSLTKEEFNRFKQEYPQDSSCVVDIEIKYDDAIDIILNDKSVSLI